MVFVRHALPGERVRAVVTEDGGGAFCRADAIAVLDPAPGRVEPPCPWARAGGCGGCDWQHADGPTQRALKTAVLREQLQRLAGVERDVTVEELPGGLLGWRHRVRLAIDDDGRAGLRAHRSHDVLPIADCPLVPSGELPPVLEQRFPARDEVEVAIDADGVRHLHPVGSRVRGPAVAQRAAGREWHLSAGTFWQVHPALAPTLVEVVGEWAQAPKAGLAWDLYGGVGLFAAVLAEQVGPDGEVRVVESARQAAADGRAALAHLEQVHWTVGRVEHVLASLPGRPDVVVADPPRRGLGRATVAALCDRAPGRVVHVACDPAALARDVALFAAQGYDLAAAARVRRIPDDPPHGVRGPLPTLTPRALTRESARLPPRVGTFAAASRHVRLLPRVEVPWTPTLTPWPLRGGRGSTTCTSSRSRCRTSRWCADPRTTRSTKWAASRSSSSAIARPDAVDPETGERYSDVIVFWVAAEEDKIALVQDESSPFFTTPHFNGHLSVLLRGSRIGELSRDELAEVVQDAWLARASKRRAADWLSSHREALA